MIDNEDVIKRHEQLEKIQDALGSYFEKEDMEIGMVMSVLLTMLINTMLGHAHIPPHEAIRLFSQAVCDYAEQAQEGEELDIEVKPNEEKMQWLN
jgi:20S proteasome alpha/beta subunit